MYAPFSSVTTVRTPCSAVLRAVTVAPGSVSPSLELTIPVSSPVCTPCATASVTSVARIAGSARAIAACFKKRIRLPPLIEQLCLRRYAARTSASRVASRVPAVTNGNRQCSRPLRFSRSAVRMQRNWIFEESRFNAMDRSALTQQDEGWMTCCVRQANVSYVRDPDTHVVRLRQFSSEQALEHGTNCISHVTVPDCGGMKLVGVSPSRSAECGAATAARVSTK